MPRTIRPHAPNQGFHITARTQGGAAWFVEDLRDEIAFFICEAARACGTHVLSLAIMSNHFHIVVKQGSFPLGWMMQRVMQRTTHRVQHMHNVKGHVFGQPYWSCVCTGADYLRQVIIYGHLNPWAAGLCLHPADYIWTSHNVFTLQTPRAPWENMIAREEGRLLFAHDSLHQDDVTRNYMRFIGYWMKRRTDRIPGDRFLFDPEAREIAPRADLGDKHWTANYSHAPVLERPLLQLRDIRDRAISVLSRIDPDVNIDMIRNAGRIKLLGRIRRQLIAVLLTDGYRGAAISRCLRVSQSVVSDVASDLQHPSAAA
jgi:putative transposase